MFEGKIIDTHLHIEGWVNEENNMEKGFEPYREERSLGAINVCALPSHNGAANNLMCIPRRESAPAPKKKPIRRLYFWNMETEIDALQSKVRWLRFALIVAIIGFLLAVALIFLLLYWQGRLDFITRFLPL